MLYRELFVSPPTREVLLRGQKVTVRSISSAEEHRCRTELLTRPVARMVPNPARGSLTTELVEEVWDQAYQRALSDYQRRLYVLIAGVAADWSPKLPCAEWSREWANAIIDEMSELLTDNEIATIVNASRAAAGQADEDAVKNS